MEKVCEYEGSSLWGMNGGQPESPDGTLLVYIKKPDLEDKRKADHRDLDLRPKYAGKRTLCLYSKGAATVVHLPLLQITITLFS